MSKAAELAALIGSQTALSNRNLIINGAMQVWQRGTTTDTITSGNYLCDRWRVAHAGTDGNVDVDRSTDVPSGQGFAYSQKISMDASETSLDAADQVNIAQRFEGQDLQQLAKGTSSAKSLTLSFWVKSSVASTYSINLRDNDNDRNIAATYVINSANTWENKTVTFAGDTTGALDNDNARSLDLTFWLDNGTDWTGGTFGTSWAANVNNTRAYDTTGWLESTSPEWYITGVQLEVGEQATPFEHRSFGDELARCQRYYLKLGGADINGGGYYRYGVGSCQGINNSNILIKPTVTMRTIPTLETTGTVSNYGIYEADAVHACTGLPSFNSGNSNPNGFAVSFTTTNGLVASGNASEAVNNNNTTAYLAFSAEM